MVAVDQLRVVLEQDLEVKRVTQRQERAAV